MSSTRQNKNWLLFVLLIILLFCTRLYASDLQKERQRLKEMGIPTTIEELGLPEISDDANGALVYQEAFELKDYLQKKYPEEFWDDEETVYLQMMSQLISFAEGPYWKTIAQWNRFEEEGFKQIPEDAGFLTKMLVPALSRAHNQEARSDALLGAAEIGLANRIYRLKYNKYADSIGQLVPEILPSLPPDPFTGKDYIYRKTDKGFVVYSVGDNLKDDGGKWGEKNKWVGDFDIVWRCDR